MEICQPGRLSLLMAVPLFALTMSTKLWAGTIQHSKLSMCMIKQA